jgi:hypothetical protein
VRFASAREAKQFLVAQIADEAQREGVSLSEIERKMLYFSETDWTLPDIDTIACVSMLSYILLGRERTAQLFTKVMAMLRTLFLEPR